MNNFKLVKTSKKNPEARLGFFKIGRSGFKTPCFAPDATRASLRHLTPEEIKKVGTELLLTNTFHLMQAPGRELLRKIGGVKKFMKWSGPLLTDSGGFQAFSLVHQKKLGQIKKDGISFSSIVYKNRGPIMLTPETSIATQLDIGSDILMALDNCIPAYTKYDAVKRSVYQTYDWEKRSLDAFRKDPRHKNRFLFGIVQGNRFKRLRELSADQITSLNFDGYAIGGVSVGEFSRAEVIKTLRIVMPFMPQTHIRYFMGIGTPLDIVKSVTLGVDLFDCVLPSRNARHGTLYTSNGILNIFNKKFINDLSAIDPKCQCSSCKKYSRAYIAHLFRVGEPLGQRLASIHNLKYYQTLMTTIQSYIKTNKDLKILIQELSKIYKK